MNQPNRNVSAKSPRRSRRGALMPAALLAVLIITILLSQFASAQLRHATAARSEARAVWLAAIAADFDYYVHDNRDVLKEDLTEEGRAINATERPPFIPREGLAEQMPGMTVKYLILRGPDGDDVFGALRLSASDGLDAELQATMARLARYGVEGQGQSIMGISELSAANALERVILTAPLSGLNTAYVLRERRAGHPPPKFVGSGALNLDNNNLTVKNLTARGDGDSRAEQVVKHPPTDQSAPATLRARKMTGTLSAVSGNVDIIDGTTRAETFTITDTLTSGGLAGLLTDSDTGGVLTVDGTIRASDWVKTDTLTTGTLDARAQMTTQSMTNTGAATTGQLTADTLLSPDVTVDGDGDFTVRQFFTNHAEINNLNIEGECHGC